MNRVEVAPSILSADFKFLDKDIKDIVKAGVSYLHFDVMDGNFVNNISFGIPVLKSLKEGNYPLIFDVHLMINDPKKYLLDFINAGADIITFHYEAVLKKDIKSLIEFVHSYHKRVGISIKPNTDVKVLDSFLNDIDLVLVMSVEPGFGGQKFMVEALSKIHYLAEYKKEHNLTYIIEVDGGINDVTSKDCIKAGVNLLVAGSYIFKSSDRKAAVRSLM
jgi:ribulose-phosphate 3-epimerase